MTLVSKHQQGRRGQPARRRVVKPAAVRRDDLLAAAVEVFRTRGVEATTVADIAAAAGVAKGTVYLYFSTKEQLVSELRARFLDELLERTLAFAARIGRGDWWALVESYVDNTVEYLLDHSDLVEVVACDVSTPEARKVLADTDAKINQVIAAGIAAGVEARAFDVEDPETTALLLQHAVFATIEHAMLYGETIDRDRLLRATHTMVHRALAPQPVVIHTRARRVRKT